MSSDDAQHRLVACRGTDDGCQHHTHARLYMDAFLREGLSIVFGHFGKTRPTSTLVQVVRLANPKMLVEIDATAAPFDD